jgi:hypothetical protein
MITNQEAALFSVAYHNTVSFLATNPTIVSVNTP